MNDIQLPIRVNFALGSLFKGVGTRLGGMIKSDVSSAKTAIKNDFKKGYLYNGTKQVSINKANADKAKAKAKFETEKAKIESVFNQAKSKFEEDTAKKDDAISKLTEKYNNEVKRLNSKIDSWS